MPWCMRGVVGVGGGGGHRHAPDGAAFSAMSCVWGFRHSCAGCVRARDAVCARCRGWAGLVAGSASPGPPRAATTGCLGLLFSLLFSLSGCAQACAPAQQPPRQQAAGTAPPGPSPTHPPRQGRSPPYGWQHHAQQNQLQVDDQAREAWHGARPGACAQLYGIPPGGCGLPCLVIRSPRQHHVRGDVPVRCACASRRRGTVTAGCHGGELTRDLI